MERKSGSAEKQKSGRAEERKSGKAEERKSGSAEKRESGGEACIERPPQGLSLAATQSARPKKAKGSHQDWCSPLLLFFSSPPLLFFSSPLLLFFSSSRLLFFSSPLLLFLSSLLFSPLLLFFSSPLLLFSSAALLLFRAVFEESLGGPGGSPDSRWNTPPSERSQKAEKKTQETSCDWMKVLYFSLTLIRV